MNQQQIKQHLRKAQTTINYHWQKLPVVTRYLLLTLLVVFILQQFFNLSFFVLHSIGLGFNPIQLVTYAFLHYDFMHLLFNALAIWMFGAQIENSWGQKRYLTFVFVCILSAALVHMLFSGSFMLGISGLDFGLLLAFGMMWPERQIFLLMPPMPIKAKYLVMGYAALLFLNILTARNNGIAHFAHLGGALGGFLLIQYWRGKPPFGK